jgi:hypothetical protein
VGYNTWRYVHSEVSNFSCLTINMHIHRSRNELRFHTLATMNVVHAPFTWCGSVIKIKINDFCFGFLYSGTVGFLMVKSHETYTQQMFPTFCILAFLKVACWNDETIMKFIQF